MTTASKTAVLLLAHGTPGSPADVPAYMSNITGGRPIPDSVMREVQHRYGTIGQSPLTEITMQQAESLSRRLGLAVSVGMRNWHPFIADTVKTMRAEGVTRAAVICLAPQNSRTSVGLYRRATLSQAEGHIEVTFVDSWHDHPQLITAFSEKLAQALNMARLELGRTDVPVIFTAHSVPCRTISGLDRDPYSNEAKRTAALVATQCGLQEADWHFAFQSQGMSGGPWIGPTMEDTIKGLAASGHSGFVVQPIGFLCDHVEVLYDVDILFTNFAAQLGLQLWRAESLNDSPLLISALEDLAHTALSRDASFTSATVR